MSSPGASTPADASTLGTLTVTALNVGMIEEDSFKSVPGKRVGQLARFIMGWLGGPGAAVVGLNEIHPTSVVKLMKEIQQAGQTMDIDIDTWQSNSLLWRAPQ